MLAEDQASSTSTQPKAPFTILKPTPQPSQEPTSTQTSDSSTSQHEPVIKLAKSLEALEVEDESNDSQDMALDEFLVNALKNRQERIFLLKLDREFCSFINNPSQPQLEFPTLNGYYRMMVHKVANYFKLTRIVDPTQKIILFKTEESAIPPLRISDLAEEEDEQPVKLMKVLKRTPGRPSSSGSATPDGSSEPERKPMTIKEREEAYAKARARIFQEEVPAKPKSPGESSDPMATADSPSTPAAGTDSPKREGSDEAAQGPKGARTPNGKKSTRQVEDQEERDGRQPSLPSSRDVSRSTSPSPSVPISSSDPNARQSGKVLRPKTKQSKTDLAAECADVRRRKSSASNASSSSGTVRTPVGLARTISSSSSQDGFQSPSPGMPLTESPTVNSPSNGAPSKGYDYFATNPNSNTGSVSPMSNGPRPSYTYPQSGAHKQHRNYNSGHPSHNGSSSSGGAVGYNNAQSNPGFMKGVNAPVFVPKKPYPKHGQPSNHQNANLYNNGPMPGYPSGPSNPAHAFNNNNNSNGNNHYTQQPHHNSASPWSERSGPPGQDGPNFYVQQDNMHGSSGQAPSQGFNYSNAPNQYSQPGPNMHSSYSIQHQHHQHHPTSNHPNSHHHHPSQRGVRRNQPSQPYYQHHSHSRTHPQMHNSQQHPPHHGGNFNGPPSRDDFAYSQGPQSSMRYGRGFDGNPSGPPPQQYGSEFYPTHGMPVDPSNGPNMYPGYQGHQVSPGDSPQNGQRYPYNHKGPYDPNWGQGPSHPAGQGHDQPSMLYNPQGPPLQGGKKPYKNYHSIPPATQQQFPSMMGGPQQGLNAMSQVLPGVGPGGIGGGGGHPHYDVERRPPKSAELFDPNGPSSGGGGQGDYGNSGRYQGLSDGGYINGQEGERLSQGHRGSFHGQYQSQPGSHYNQQASQPTHAPIAMNRSYSSSSSSTGYTGGNTSSPGPHGGKKNHNLLYDYTVPTMPFDGNVKSATPEADKAPALGHILEIFAYDAQDDIFEDLVLPAGSKIRRLNSANKEVLGPVLVVFKNATLANEAMAAFQEGKSTWMGPEAKLRFESSTPSSVVPESSESVGSTTELEQQGGGDDEDVAAAATTEENVEEEEATTPSTRLQLRFNVKIWTPVLVNSVTPLKAQAQLSASPSNDSANNSTSSASSNGAARSENGEDKDQEDVTPSACKEVASSLPSPTLQKGGSETVIVDESS
ncbi:R3H domain-containing protein 1 [Mortierella sp. NVP41]|nr:R3H domain-containing protein 1 [Mortierella sp. NVP41]